jgi:predicted HicB family RNase H-like nuclease
MTLISTEQADTVRRTLRISKTLDTKVRVEAEQSKRSLNKELEYLIEKGLQEEVVQ